MTSGIVRRIDELGRIVIPKEIRKNLRIKEGDTLEIFVEKEKIILDKSSVFDNLKSLSQNLTDSIYNYVKKEVLITDRDKIIAYSGERKKEYINKKISDSVIKKIVNREEIVQKGVITIIDKEEMDCYYIFNTLTINGDEIGSIIMYSDELQIKEGEIRILEICKTFLENYLEE